MYLLCIWVGKPDVGSQVHSRFMDKKPEEMTNKGSVPSPEAWHIEIKHLVALFCLGSCRLMPHRPFFDCRTLTSNQMFLNCPWHLSTIW